MEAEPGQDIAAHEEPCPDDQNKDQKFFHGFTLVLSSRSERGKRSASTGRGIGRNRVW